MGKLAAIVLLPFAAFGQTFEEATVRLSAPSSTDSRMVDGATRFEFLYASVKGLLALAYQVNPQNVRGPDWIDAEMIDVIARKPLHTTGDGERRMLQALLADRFKLVVHRDSYDLTAFDLVVAEGGPRLKSADENVAAARANTGQMKGPARSLNATLSMARLAAALQIALESAVTDVTGLTGAFDIVLQWSPEDAIAAELPGATFPPLAKALEQQLGLKLVARKIKVNTLVVDSGQRIPAELDDRARPRPRANLFPPPRRHTYMRASHLFIFAAVPAFAQAPGFDAADVHAVPRSAFFTMRRSPEAFHFGRYEAHAVTMAELIASAYNISLDNVTGGPAWLEDDRYEVIAKMAPATKIDTAHLMLQTLLADRFKLVVHKGAKPLPAFVLSMGKGKPKLTEAAASGESGCHAEPPSGGGPPPYTTVHCRNVTMERLAGDLRSMAGAYLNLPVVDNTNLKGAWDFDLVWTGRGMYERQGGVTIFEAVDKLGLKLEQQNTPTPVLVVDSVNRTPSANAPGVNTQLAPAPLEFEVAALKLSSPAAPGAMGGFQPGGRVDMHGLPLRALITMAWEIDPGVEIPGAPDWLNGTFVDLVAKVSTTEKLDFNDLAGPMLRNLLTERFQMKTHYEQRPETAYKLVAVKPKLQKADPTARSKCKTDRPIVTTGVPILQVVCRNVTMEQFAAELPSFAASYLRYDVPDATGIEGAWDFSFTFSLVPPGMGGGRDGGGRKGGGSPQPAPSSDAASDPNGAMSLFDAVSRQLGLKLEIEKRPVPVFVIDRIEPKPLDN